jgi:hypothetical protein
MTHTRLDEDRGVPTLTFTRDEKLDAVSAEMLEPLRAPPPKRAGLLTVAWRPILPPSCRYRRSRAASVRKQTIVREEIPPAGSLACRST